MRTVLVNACWSSGVNARSACWTRAPNCDSTSLGTSVGNCVQKNTPTPRERISLTVCSTCSRNALEASVNSRWASSKKNTSLGLSTSPISGRVLKRSDSTHIKKVENSTGRAAWSPSSSSEMTPWPLSSNRNRSLGFEFRLAEKGVGAFGFQVDQSTQDDAGRLRGDAAQRLQLGLALVAGEIADHRAQVLQVAAARSFCWSAQWKIKPSVDS